MLSIFDGAGSSRSYRRRDFLRIGTLAVGGLALPRFLASRIGAAEKSIVRDRSVVLLFLQGGPPQIETFDPKLDGPAYSRSVTGHLPTSIPGVHFGGTFPELARLADRVSIVRSFGTARGGVSHEGGYEALLTGGGNPYKAPMGALYGRATGSLHPQTGVPRNTIILPETIDPEIELGRPSGAFTYRQTRRYFATAGRLGAEYEPFDPSGGGELLEDLTLELPRERFDDRRRLLAAVDRLRRRLDGAPEIEGLDTIRRQAYDVLLRGISEAFDLSKENPQTLARYDTSHLVPMKKIRRGGPLYWNNFNRSTNLLGKQMLLARRLCEAGCGFVTVVDSCWDFHDDGNNPPVKVGMDVLGPQLDHAVSAFLEDVEARGLSDRILLIVTAEMGRTPKKGGKSGGGSGHWGNLAPLLLAGGGLQMGRAIGRSERDGAHPATDPYRPEHLLATVMHTLFDVGEVRLRTDLPTDLVKLITEGEPIRELL